MKFLLTSAGIKNPSIHDALVKLLGKPISESSALCIPTAMYPFPNGAIGAYKFISGTAPSPMCELGWKSLGVLELTALPSINREYWVAAVEETDALLVWGGHAAYLCSWMQRSGLADLFPELRETVYVGVSAGSIVATPYNCDAAWNGPNPFTGNDDMLGLVDFAVVPHLDHESFPEKSMAGAEQWAATVPAPTYAIDDQTAIKVVDGAAEVVSDGHWKLFAKDRA